ncbi:hypothetical protein NDI86_20655 [Halomicroarcula sp. S3CR25-11]|uniref:Uncharacterized protein n=1 Tax=Haloarcula onubensis TaxID=2950539 RepID=A0ABU2FWH8_9EURY|nr:hypothetical protein [Halomicroarcula sp. S3CR25-11]MDS0284511.1 hypothetical protein [Halomicroarcula sp. S3CR25-11]
MDIGDISVDEAGSLAHTSGGSFSNHLDEFQAQWCVAIAEAVVAPELDHRLLVLVTLFTGLSIQHELKRLFLELFSVGDGDDLNRSPNKSYS